MAVARVAEVLRLRILLAALCVAVAGTAAHAERVKVGSFWIDRTEVTIGAFAAYTKANGTQTAAEKEGGGFEYGAGWERRPGWTWRSPYGKPGMEAEPAVHVSWSEAHDFCRYAGGRLPRWAEWREAAYTERRRAPKDGFVTGRTYEYPTGGTPDGMNNSRKRHVAVGTTKRGVNGLYDMGANVWEWLADRRDEDALTAGGSWWYGPDKTRESGAQWKPAKFYAIYIGFRCAYDAGPAK